MFAGISGPGLRAQEPARLPAMVVKAPIEKPGPRTVAGIARDTFAVGIDSVEITVPSLQRITVTDGDGKFRLNGVHSGKYTVRARKIGYAPQVRELVVDDSGGVVAFDLLPLHRALPTMVVSSKRGGLSGTVGDTAYRAIAGATIALLGDGGQAFTDSTGSFRLDLDPGKYLVAVRAPGYGDKLVSVKLPADSGRHLTVLLAPYQRIAREAWNVDDLGERLARRNKLQTSFYSHDDMVDMGITWVGDVVQGGVTRTGSRIQVDHDCAAVLNGGPATVNLSTLTIDEVESVEIYPPPSAPGRTLLPNRPPSRIVGKKGVADSRAIVPITNAGRAGMENAGRTCATVYVWLR